MPSSASPQLQVVVEEGQRPVGSVGFEPERGAGKFDGERVLVHTVDAVGDDVAQRVAVVGRQRVAVGG
jgi:hypothetical protein